MRQNKIRYILPILNKCCRLKDCSEIHCRVFWCIQTKKVQKKRKKKTRWAKWNKATTFALLFWRVNSCVSGSVLPVLPLPSCSSPGCRLSAPRSVPARTTAACFSFSFNWTRRADPTWPPLPFIGWRMDRTHLSWPKLIPEHHTEETVYCRTSTFTCHTSGEYLYIVVLVLLLLKYMMWVLSPPGTFCSINVRRSDSSAQIYLPQITGWTTT